MFLPPVAPTAITLERRRFRLWPAALLIWPLSLGVSAIPIAVAAGAWIEPAPRPAGVAALGVLALVVLIPAVWLTVAASLERRRAQLELHHGGLRITHPDLLREPLDVPWGQLRAFDVDAGRTRGRFRVHWRSDPYGSGDLDGFLWWNRFSAIAVLAPRAAKPNVALLFDPPVAAPRPWIEREEGVLRGERLAGVLLAVTDATQAERELDRWRAIRPLTMPDAITLHEHLGDPGEGSATGARRALRRRHALLAGTLCSAIGLLIPVLILGSFLHVLVLYDLGRRRDALALTAVGLLAIAVAILIRV